MYADDDQTYLTVESVMEEFGVERDEARHALHRLKSDQSRNNRGRDDLYRVKAEPQSIRYLLRKYLGVTE